MTIRFWLLALILFACDVISYAQTYDQAASQLQFINHYGKAYSKGYAGPSYSGSEHLTLDWMPMDIRFRDTTLRFDAVKLNLMNATLDILFQGEEKTISNMHFEYVATTDVRPRKFYPAFKTRFNDKTLEGFMEVIGEEGDEKILVQHYIYIKEPNPQAHITGGATIPRLMKQTDNYIKKGSKLTLIRKKKDLLDFYQGQRKALEQYLKDNQTDINNPTQLHALVDWMSRTT